MTDTPEMTTETLPSYLTERYKGWVSSYFSQNKAWFARLAEEGQRPRAMVIQCCDSRVNAVAMFGAEPGDLFVVRNVANLVPPYNPDHQHHGTSAAVEYAVNVLKVAHIVVVGHSNCGGVHACHDMCAGKAPELDDSSTATASVVSGSASLGLAIFLAFALGFFSSSATSSGEKSLCLQCTRYHMLGISAAITWLCPSSCCRPSPLSVVRPEVPPIRKPRARISPAAQARSPMR